MPTGCPIWSPAVVCCAPLPATHTVVHGGPVVRDGIVTTLDIQPVMREHNRHPARLLES
ncbi:hypothetical protein [Lichenicoccus sp.]|uniref:hypothetical protein n=1 Tax=Lichenicoccus sp. TaxID=2781899 RepID=UPI003D1075A9